MENGGKEKQFFASQTSQVPVSGGKGWQFYATCFAKNNENGCKDQESKAKLAYQNTGNRDCGGKTFNSEIKRAPSFEGALCFFQGLELLLCLVSCRCGCNAFLPLDCIDQVEGDDADQTSEYDRHQILGDLDTLGAEDLPYDESGCTGDD